MAETQTITAAEALALYTKMHRRILAPTEKDEDENEGRNAGGGESSEQEEVDEDSEEERLLTDAERRTRLLVLAALRRVTATSEEDKPEVNYTAGEHYHPGQVALFLGEVVAGVVETEGGLGPAIELYNEALQVPGLGDEHRTILVANAATALKTAATDSDAIPAAAATPSYLPEGTLNP